MNKQLLTIKELSALLNIPKSRVYSLVFYKQIPYTKLGASLRFDSEKIHNWIEEQSVKEENK